MPPKSFLAALLFGLMAVTAVAEETPVFKLDKRFILPANAADKLLHQCSRGTPEHPDSFWQPTDMEVDELETRLLSFLGPNVQKGLPPARVYDRQYMGFMKAGQKYIYGNFYPAGENGTSFEPTSQGMVVCDGGSAFWGIVYRMVDKQFEPPAFNGFAR